MGALVGTGLAAVVWCLSDLLSATRLPIYRDLLPFVYPYRAFLAEHLVRGEVPLWNPFVQLGVPFMASLHASAFYPLSLILLVPLPLGFNLFILAHFIVAWVGTTLWLHDRGESPPGVAAGALVFTIGGYLVASVTNTAHLQAAVWAPWVLLGWGRVCRGERCFLATVALLVVQLLAGAPEIWITMVVLLTGWTLFAAPMGAHRRIGCAVRLVGCVIIVFVLAAFQILPTLEYLATSRRAGVLPAAELVHWSMSPTALLQLVFPHSTVLQGEFERGTIGALLEPTLPLVHSIYLGIAGLCLAVAGVVTGRERIFWAAMAMFGVLLSLGPHSPLYGFLLTLVPQLIGRIRYPEKFLFLFHVGAVALVARGTSAVVRGDRRALRASTVTAVTLGLLTLGLSLIGWFEPRRLESLAAVLSGRGDWPRDAFTGSAVDLAYKADRAFVLFFGWALIAVASIRNRIGRSMFASLAFLLLAGDLVSTHRGFWPSISIEDLERAPVLIDASSLRMERKRLFHYQTTTEGRSVPGLTDWVPSLHERRDLRGLAFRQWQILFFAMGMLSDVGVVSAQDSIAGQAHLEKMLRNLPRDRAVDLLGRFGVEILIGPNELSAANLEKLGSPSAEIFAYRVRSARPFAFLVSDLEVVPSPWETLARMVAPGFRAESTAILDQLPDGWTPPSEPLVSEEGVVLRSAGTDELELDTSCKVPRLLLVNSAHFPGWIAEIDGRRSQILRANGLVQGVVVPAGDHRVRLVYQPLSFRIGLAISLVGIVIVAAAGLLGRSRVVRP